MNTQAPKPKYIFVNPNTANEFTDALRKILFERLLTLHRDNAIVDC